MNTFFIYCCYWCQRNSPSLQASCTTLVPCLLREPPCCCSASNSHDATVGYDIALTQTAALAQILPLISSRRRKEAKRKRLRAGRSHSSAGRKCWTNGRHPLACEIVAEMPGISYRASAGGYKVLSSAVQKQHMNRPLRWMLNICVAPAQSFTISFSCADIIVFSTARFIDQLTVQQQRAVLRILLVHGCDYCLRKTRSLNPIRQMLFAIVSRPSPVVSNWECR